MRGQLKKTLNGNAGRFRPDIGHDPKSAYHAVRVLYTATRWKKTGILSAYIDDATIRRLCLEIKHGEHEVDYVVSLIESMTENLEMIECHLSIPKEPNYKFWDDFLIDAYYEHCRKER